MTHEETPAYNFKDMIVENFIQYIFYTYFGTDKYMKADGVGKYYFEIVPAHI
jgi:hypothetical protein